MYNCSYHYAFVVDHEGIVHYRGSSGNFADIVAAIDEVLDAPEAELAGVGNAPSDAVVLEAAYPNPFNRSTRIPFTVSDDVGGLEVTVDIVDQRGRVVRVLASGSRPAGRHEVVWDGRDTTARRMPSGAHLVRLRSGAVARDILPGCPP